MTTEFVESGSNTVLVAECLCVVVADHRDKGEEAGAVGAPQGRKDSDPDCQDASCWTGVRLLSYGCIAQMPFWLCLICVLSLSLVLQLE